MAEKTDKTALKDLSIREILEYEQAARLVCMVYEKTIKQYDNSLIMDCKEYKIFEKYNNLHRSIIGELENRLNQLA